MNLKLSKVTKAPPELDNYAVVLCGGGAAGRWQAGVLSALAHAGILEQTKVIIGTSVGGLNAGLFTTCGAAILPGDDKPSANVLLKEDMGTVTFADGTVDTIPPPHPFETAVSVWENIKSNKDVYAGTISSLWDKIGAGFGFLFNRPSILDPKPLHTTLDGLFKNVTLKDASEMLGIQLILSSLDLNTQKEEFYTSFGDNQDMALSDALKRTSAIPLIFKSIKGTDMDDKKNMHSHWHVDGGVGANNPMVAINMYNQAFPGAKVKKILIVYCYPDEMTDIGTNIVKPELLKDFSSMKDVALGLVPAAMNSQEQLVEAWAELFVQETGWDIMAMWPATTPCDALDFTKTELLQKGYDYGVVGMGWDYRNKAHIHVLDFLRK